MVEGAWTVVLVNISKPPCTLRNSQRIGKPLLVKPCRKIKYISINMNRNKKALIKYWRLASLHSFQWHKGQVNFTFGPSSLLSSFAGTTMHLEQIA
jgi:hypothetical protein